MVYTTVEIKVPRGMEQYLGMESDETALQRNALLYPQILNKKISHGRVAEILGINKMDLIDLYARMGFHYLDQTMDELDKDLQTFQEVVMSEVTA